MRTRPNPKLIEKTRAEFLKATEGVPPNVSNPFGGGGPNPPEAVRFPHGSRIAVLKHSEPVGYHRRTLRFVVEHSREMVIDGTGAFYGEHLNKVSHNQQVQKMINNHNEAALSEVIGFVLILALITVAFSLYLVYGVPAQGRENEIIHMGVVKDQFVDYKVALDSLFTNNMVGTSISNIFSLGTSGGYTQGSNSVFPIMSPANSGGIFSINRRTLGNETLTIKSQSYVTGTGTTTSVDMSTTAKRINFTPSHVYVNISIPSSVPINITGSYGLTVNTTKWIATVNLTPQSTYYIVYKPLYSTNPCPLTPNGTGILARLVLPGGGPGAEQTGCLLPLNQSRYAGTDLTVSITKGNILTMQNYVVDKNVSSGGKYTLDLMDSTYGLNTVTLPGDSIRLAEGKKLGSTSGTGNFTYNFVLMDNYAISPIPLGAIEYRADNNYWIPQTYYYQMGGVFLNQPGENTTYKLPPEISFSKSTEGTDIITTVNINALVISNPEGGSIIGGNSPVKLKTSLMSKSALPYAVGTANTKWIRIAINTSDDQARQMWTNYFNYTARAAYIPNTFTGNTTTESYIFINGSDLSPNGLLDINVIGSIATYKTIVYGVGG